MIEDPTYTPPASTITRLTTKPVQVTQGEEGPTDKEDESFLSTPEGLGAVVGAVALLSIMVLVLSICLCYNGICCNKSVKNERTES